VKIFKRLAVLVLAAIIVPTLAAEQRCPENIVGLPFRLAHRSRILRKATAQYTILDMPNEVPVTGAEFAPPKKMGRTGPRFFPSFGRFLKAVLKNHVFFDGNLLVSLWSLFG
jgi:hypothetical protein